MAFFCLPFDKAQAFKQALANRDIQIADLLKMSTEDRTAVFEKFAGSDAKQMNTMFEEKLVLKNKIAGLRNFINKVTSDGRYSDEQKAKLAQAASDYKAQQMQRIFSPTEDQTFLADLAEKTAGSKVSIEESNKIGALAKKMNEALKLPADNPSGVSNAYIKAAADYQEYVSSLQPVSGLSLIFRNLTTIMRNNLLLNFSTPIKTFSGQFENAIMDTFTRRLANRSMGGKNSDLVAQMNKEAWQTFRKTGLNTFSMDSIDDTGKLGEQKRLTVPAGRISGNPVMRGAEIATRGIARISNKVAIDWEHNITFTKFYQKTWLDMANILSSKMSKTKEGAAAIMKDAARIEPLTEEGKIVRAEAQFQAGRVTGVQDTFLSNGSMMVVKWFDKQVPGLGSFLFQIVKIPTNIITYGIENAGGGLVSGAMNMYKGRKLMASEDIAAKNHGAAIFARGAQTLIRTAGVMTASSMIAASLNKNDFKQDRYGDNFVNIGGTWINMEYFYAISPSLAGFMTARKTKNKSITDNITQYIAGVGGQLRRLPVVDDANTIISDLTNADSSQGVGKYIKSIGTQRLQPAFLRQLEQGNGIHGLFFSSTGLPSKKELNKLGAK